MPEPTKTPEPTNMETLLGGVDLTIKYLDGTSETVRVKQLPIRQYDTYLRTQDDEPAQIELLCGKPAGWSDTLSMESVEAIINEGTRINADFFGRWLQRRLARMERLVPGSVPRLVAGNLNPTSPTLPPTSPLPSA